MGAHTFRVVQVDEEALAKRAGAPCYGLFDPESQTIWVVAARRGLSESLRAQTFLHELAHALLWTVNSKDYGNERTVDALGHALLQYFRTKDR